MSEAAVRLRGVSYTPAGAPGPVLDAVDLEAAPGEVLLLAGPSGAGKSTLLHLLAGLLEDAAQDTAEGGGPSLSGTVHVGGRAGLVQQDPETQVVMSRIGDDVAFGCENLGVAPEEIWPRVKDALIAVGLGELPLHHPTAALSGGQKQRLAVAGLLAMRPAVWLLDEPTANLDPDGATEVRDVVLRTARSSGATVVVVEHRLDAWLEEGGVDRLVVLAPQRTGEGASVVADGEPAAVLGDAAVASRLADAGVWVPGRRPRLAAWEPTPHGGDEHALRAHGLAVTRRAVPRREAARGRALAKDPTLASVSGVELAVAPGEALCLLGRNGQGKTALALTLAGVQRPVAGEVAVAGADPNRMRGRELVRAVGLVFQDPEHQFVARSVREELAFGPRRAGASQEEAEARAQELLDRLGLGHLADANPYLLSGGQQRRLSVGTALATRPGVLILDEPTFGQDAVTWASLVELLREELDRGAAIVAVTHDEAFVEALHSRRVLVECGAAVELGAAGAREVAA